MFAADSADMETCGKCPAQTGRECFKDAQDHASEVEAADEMDKRYASVHI